MGIRKPVDSITVRFPLVTTLPNFHWGSKQAMGKFPPAIYFLVTFQLSLWFLLHISLLNVLKFLRPFLASVHLLISAELYKMSWHQRHLILLTNSPCFMFIHPATVDSLQKPVHQTYLTSFQGQPPFPVALHILENTWSWIKLVSHTKTWNCHTRKEQQDRFNFFRLNYHIK